MRARDTLLDGRTAGRERNRDAVVDAMLDLYGAGILEPSADEIAAQSGVSRRSVFRYFEDLDDLCRAAIARQKDRVSHLFLIDDGVADWEVELAAAAAAEVGSLMYRRVILHEQAGGGGFGDPFTRDPERVVADVRNEKITPEYARREHGVVIDPVTLCADAALTRALRAAPRG